jgi:excisionase family DNA binding protein
MNPSKSRPSRQRLTCSIGEAAELLGIGRASAYEAARAGQIPILVIGRRRVVPLAALHRMLGVDADAK